MAAPGGTAKLDERGRVVLPADMRRRLEMHPGDELVVTEEPGGTLRLQSRRSAAHALFGLAGRLEHSAVDDLRDDRNRDTAAETGSA
jgi:AbrB family looped-hinge helix DNA binding protein